MADKVRYMLTEDDDGHWYVIPVSRQAEFDAWVSSEDCADVPDWAEPVNGAPELVTFTSHRIR